MMEIGRNRFGVDKYFKQRANATKEYFSNEPKVEKEINDLIEKLFEQKFIDNLK